MKDILFEKHLQILDERVQSGHDDIDKAAVACANTTKEIAKGFAEWIGDNYIGSTSDNNKWFKMNYHDDETEFTTEELLEKYLETLK